MDNKQNNLLAFIAVMLAGIFGGAIGVFGKIGLREIPPFSFTFLRFFIASLFLFPLLIREKPKISKDVWKIFLLSLLATANVTLFAFGIKLTTATIAQLLYAVVPVVAGIFSYFLLKEKFNLQKLTGIFIGFLGVATLIVLPVIGKKSQFSGNLSGDVIILTAIVCFSLYSVLSKKFQKNYSPIFLTTVFAVTTSVILFVLAVSEFISNPQWVQNLSSSAVIATLYIGIFGGVVYYLLYQYAIKHGTPVIASMTMFVQPVATFIWAFVLLSERLTLGIMFGGVLAVVGALIVSVNRKNIKELLKK